MIDKVAQIKALSDDQIRLSQNWNEMTPEEVQLWVLNNGINSGTGQASSGPGQSTVTPGRFA
jgi:hypothetical protein